MITFGVCSKFMVVRRETWSTYRSRCRSSSDTIDFRLHVVSCLFCLLFSKSFSVMDPNVSFDHLESFIEKLNSQATNNDVIQQTRSSEYFRYEGAILETNIGLSVIRESDASLSQLFESLGPLITSTTVQKRKIGYQLVNDALSTTKRSLSEQESRLICTFFCNRLKDETLVMESILSILSLIVDRNICTDMITTLFSTILNELFIPSLPVEERFQLFQLISQIMDKHLNVLKNTADFPILFSQIFEGERDPRCLLVYFQVFAKTISNI